MKKLLTTIFSLMLMLVLIPISVNSNEIEAEEDPTPLTFTANTAGSTVSFKWVSKQEGTNVEISTDGTNWTTYTAGDTITLENANDYVQFRGTNVITDENNHFSMNTGSITASGDVTSLTNRTGGDVALTIEKCYQYMFYNCTSLTTAPNLPSTTLTNYCYDYMFYHCTNLTTAPELPATTLASGCYAHMFANCTNLTTAPELPAGKEVGGKTVGSLANNCYESMFSNCTGLLTAPELPATTLADYCYSRMFYDCESLTTMPELPATILTDNCYDYMFTNCTKLETVQELPATTLAFACYEYMFKGCTNLTTAPQLIVGKDGKGSLASCCYYGMFEDCTSLIEAPKLPATTLKLSCYYEMFKNCTSLTEPVDISHVEVLDKYCCENMYYGCTGIAISDTQDETYTKAWKATSATASAEEWNKDMFAGTSGLFTGAPENNKNYYLKVAGTIKYTCGDDVMITDDGKAHYISMNVTEPVTGVTVSYSVNGGNWQTGSSYQITDGKSCVSLGTIKFKVSALGYKTVIVERKFEIAPAIKDGTTPSFTGITGTLSYTKGQANNCVIVINHNIEDTTDVLIYKDGSETPIDQSNYEVSDGSTKITIFADYLNGLSVGEHKFEVYISYGTGDYYTYNLVLTAKSNPTPYVPVDTSCK